MLTKQNLTKGGELETVGRAFLHAVHVVAEGEDQLEDLLQPLAALHLLRRLQHGLDLGAELVQPDCELLLVVESPQALLVVSHSEEISRSSMDDKLLPSSPLYHHHHCLSWLLLGKLKEESVCARQVVDLLRVLVQQRLASNSS